MPPRQRPARLALKRYFDAPIVIAGRARLLAVCAMLSVPPGERCLCRRSSDQTADPRSRIHGSVPLRRPGRRPRQYAGAAEREGRNFRRPRDHRDLEAAPANARLRDSVTTMSSTGPWRMSARTTPAIPPSRSRSSCGCGAASRRRTGPSSSAVRRSPPSTTASSASSAGSGARPTAGVVAIAGAACRQVRRAAADPGGRDHVVHVVHGRAVLPSDGADGG